MDHHDVFALEDTDRVETDLIQLEIDTGYVLPIKQPQRMPYTAKEEVAKKLQRMKQMRLNFKSKIETTYKLLDVPVVTNAIYKDQHCTYIHRN